jgi:hypothetical protein
MQSLPGSRHQRKELEGLNFKAPIPRASSDAGRIAHKKMTETRSNLARVM